MILHIASDSANLIMYPYIEMVNKFFDKKEHFFILCSKNKYIQKYQNAISKDIFTQEEFFIEKIKEADKVILHGIWYDKLCEILLKINDFKKIYWEMWGGDFYFPEKQSYIKKRCFKKIENFIGIDFDKKYLIENYNVLIKKSFFAFMYPSNVFKKLNKKYLKKKKKIYILVGNSADKTNNHLHILRKLKKEKLKNFKLFLPLSYGGDKKYIDYVKRKAKNMFKDKVIILDKKLSFEEYNKLLSNVDIALFAHNRQQAFGNILKLLGFNKSIYVYYAPIYNFFRNKHIEIFNLKRDKILKDKILKNSLYLKKVNSLNKTIKDNLNIFMDS